MNFITNDTNQFQNTKIRFPEKKSLIMILLKKVYSIFSFIREKTKKDFGH